MASSALHNANLKSATPAPYPARTKQAAAVINGIHTDVMSIAFTDKILLTIAQEGRLAQWVHVPMHETLASMADLHLASHHHAEEGGILPRSDLTATTVLGGTMASVDILSRLLATQIATAILMKNRSESRTLVLGVGLKELTAERHTFFAFIDLALQCL